MPHDEDNIETPERGDWRIRRDYAHARRIGAIARASFQAVYEGWQGPALLRDDVATQTAVEAQIAASCLGHKPLYFDPWLLTIRARLTVHLRASLPGNVRVANLPSGLVVFRPEKIRPILDADTAFYRPGGEDDLAAIERVCASGDNGELLGYGARNWFEPHGARVTLSGPDGVMFMFFVSNAHEAEFYALDRLRDIASYTLLPLEYDISQP